MDDSVRAAGDSHRSSHLFGQIIDITIRLVVILGLCLLSFVILQPFLLPMLWGIILSVACYPVFKSIAARVQNRKKLAAFLTSGLLISLILLPCLLLGESLYRGIQSIRGAWENGTITIPAPPNHLKEWPLIGERLYQFWLLASSNIAAALKPMSSEIRSAFGWVLAAATNFGFTLVQFLFAIVVAGVLFATSEKCTHAATALCNRLDSRKGSEFLSTSTTTIRNVAKGILGVAFIQALLTGIGMGIAGVPAAGLWALLSLILGIIQIGVAPVLIGATIYLFSTAATVTASLFILWSLLVIPLDNILKPLLLGKGAPVPTLIIFLGALGGFLKFSLIGLFVGAVILSLAYKLLLIWLNLEEYPGGAMAAHEPPLPLPDDAAG